MDLRFAFRTLSKNPAFTVLAVVVLALGMGANTAIFSVVHALLLKPLSYPEPERIVSVYTHWLRSGRNGNISAPDFHDWKKQSSTLENLAYFSAVETNVVVDGIAGYAHVAMVSEGFFDVFGVRPRAGTLLTPAEMQPGAAPLALISENFWQQRMGADPKAIGKTVRHGGRVFTVVGILPFRYPDRTDLWYSAGQEEENPNRTGHNYLGIARLKPGRTVEEANTELKGIAARLAAEYPKENAGKSAIAIPLREDMVQNVQTTLLLLFGAVALVVLIACANVANLLLAKATSRTREIAIRAAVGASRWHVIRLMLWECLLLSLAAAALGLLLSYWGMDALALAAPRDMPRLDEVRLDWTVLGFALLTSLTATLLFGLAPAISASKADLNEALKQAARSSSGGTGSLLRSCLVTSEIALSVMLAIGAGLLIRSLVQLNRSPMGFDTEKLLLVETLTPAEDRAGALRQLRFYTEALQQIGTLPGVRAVGAVTAPPGMLARSNGSVQVEGRPFDGDWTKLPNALFTVATPGYLQSIGIPVRDGRNIEDRDHATAPYTVVINEAFAKLAFPNENPLGRRLRCGLDSPEWMTVVGVAGNVRQQGPAQQPAPELIMPYLQHPLPATYMTLTVRTDGEPSLLQEPIRARMRSIDPGVPARFETMDTSLAGVTAQPRFRTQLLALLAGLAVVLAMIGVYGVMAYSVAQRGREIGLRMALGADSKDIARMVLGQGARLAGTGLIIGILGALVTGRLLQGFLFEVRTLDPLVYGTVTAGALLAVTLAAWGPARRAAAMDPLQVLRQD